MSIKDLKVNELKGISVKRTALFKKLGIETVHDLITHFPRGYIDYTRPSCFADAEIGAYTVIRAVASKKMKPFISGRNGLSIFKVILADALSEDEMVCVFFNNPYSFDKIYVGKEYLLYGKIGGSELLREILNPQFIEPGTPPLVPKYRLTSGLTHVMVMNSVKSALPLYDLPDPLPETVLAEYGLCDKKTALHTIHFPESEADCQKARRRLAFEELLTLRLGMTLLKNRNRELTGAVMENIDISEFYAALPFEPTNAQKRAIEDAVCDLIKPAPMNRLLQGDVGSGKTLVAAAVCYFAYKNSYQSVVMAPTEILAIQHYETFKAFLEPLGVKPVLLIGSLSASEKKAAKDAIQSGEANVAIGTQALIQKSVAFHRLGFTVTDEQHRFGVKQRSALIAKGENPHTLVMSATPIPRTLALIIYADLDISVLDEMPKGRIPIKTYCVDTSFRERLYKFILKHVAEGRQAYIVCPLIDGENENEKASAVKYFETLRENWFSNITCGLLHGKMKQNEKDDVMRAFKNNEISVLVSTTVIEVGVDVPNSVIMLIENAEQFGLSQLHQLRGRVGRGCEQSYCVLVTDNLSPYTKARTEIMTATSDGFVIANEDLKLRGPGDFFGSKQHGLPELKVADMTTDIGLVDEAGRAAAQILGSDPRLEMPENKGIAQLAADLFGEDIIHGFN